MKSNKVLALAVMVLTGLCVVSVNRTTTLAAITPAAPASAFTGTWQTTWKTTDGRTVSAPISVKVDSGDPNALDGVVIAKGADGSMYGTLSSDGNTWSGTWWNNDGTHGTFTFTLKDKKKFEGSYTASGFTGNFFWNGTR